MAFKYREKKNKYFKEYIRKWRAEKRSKKLETEAKVVSDEISIPEYFYFISNSVKGPAYLNVLREIRNNFGRFV